MGNFARDQDDHMRQTAQIEVCAKFLKEGRDMNVKTDELIRDDL